MSPREVFCKPVVPAVTPDLIRGPAAWAVAKEKPDPGSEAGVTRNQG